MNRIVVIVALAIVGACATTPEGAVVLTKDDIANFETESNDRLQKARLLVGILDNYQIREMLEAQVSDVTTEYYQAGHGVYLEYTSPNHQVFMWYPGNAVAVTGTWDIPEQFDPPRVCYKYFNAYHGVTGEYEPNECVDTAQTLGNVDELEARRGDTFALSSGRVPYVKTGNARVVWPEKPTTEGAAAE